MTTVERITQMILNGKINDAKSEIKSDSEFAKSTGREPHLNDLQVRDLHQAIAEAEINV